MTPVGWLKRVTTSWATEVLSGFAPPQSTSQSDALGLAPLPNEVDYQGTFRRLLRGGTRLAALGLVAAVWLAALAPIWRWGRFATISSLLPAERAALLSDLLRHPLFAVRELTLLLKLAAALALLGTASVRARSGYDNVQAAAKLESGLQRRLPLMAANGKRSVS
ncbi:MAG TPA: hypothetical protein VHM19_07705 [Polyangiales bacterium]|jgi:hypothetical protein|nr:hypothetical protein [Polyangiales bacterium]